MGLAEDFQADQATRQQSQQFQLENDFRAYLQDQAQGGSIRQAPPGEAGKENYPIGAVVGGVGGAVAGGLVGPATAIAGSAAGAAAGQFVQGRIERALDDKTAPQDTAAEQYRIAREGAIAGGLEMLGQAAGFLLPKVRNMASFAPAVTKEARDAMKFVTEHGGLEQSLLPAEMTSNRFLDIMQNISEHSLLGGGAISTFKRDRDAFNTQLAQSIVGRYGPAMDADAIGRAVADSASRNLESAKFPAKFIYEAIESAAAPQYAKAPRRVTVSKETEPITKSVVKRETVKRDERGGKPASSIDTGLLDESGRPITREQEAVDPELIGLKVKTTFQDIQVGEQLQRMKVMVTDQETQVGGARIDLRTLKNELAGMSRTAEEGGGLADAAMGNTLLAFINKKPDIVSYPVAKAMRTEIRAYRDQLMNSPETKNAPGIAKAKSIYESLTERIRSGLADDDPFLATMWDEANLIEAGANQQFNTKMIRELVKLADVRGANAPEAIAEKIWRPGRPTQVKVVRNALDPSTWHKLQGIEMDRLMTDSMVDGVPNGMKMESAFFGKGGLGKDVLTAGYDPGTVKELKGFIDALKVQQRNSPDNTGSMWIQLSQASQAVGAIGGAVGLMSDDYGGKGLTSAGAAILFAPAVVGRIMVSPGGIKYLTDAVTSGPKTKAFAVAAAQIGKILQAGIERTASPSVPDTAETRQRSLPSSTMPPSMPLQQ